MKIMAFGIKNPNSICLADDSGDKSTENWYFMPNNVRDYIKKFPKGTLIEATVEVDEKGKRLTFFKPQAGATMNPAGTTTGGGTSSGTYEKKSSWGRSPDEQNLILAQAIMHAVSRTIKGLDGVDLNNIDSTIDVLYAKYASKVEEYRKSLAAA